MAAKYEEIYQSLLNRIEQEEFPVGETIPKEFDLMEEYACSRDTIRKALQLLSQNGYIQKRSVKVLWSWIVHAMNFLSVVLSVLKSWLLRCMAVWKRL